MANLRTPAKWLLDWFRGTNNGPVSVTPETVTGIPAVWYAVNKIGNMFAQLPFQPKRRLAPRGAVNATDHISYQVVKYQNNAYQIAPIFRQKIIVDALLWGDGRAAVVNGGREHLPLDPRCTLTVMVEGSKYHLTLPTLDDRIIQFASMAETLAESELILRDAFVLNKDKVIVLPDRMVLHLLGLTLDGVTGVSIVEVARQVFETAKLSRQHLNNQWEKGFTGRLMLEAPPGSLRDESQAKEFLENFKQSHAIDGDNETVGLLREGVQANVLTMSGRDAQWAEQISESRRDIALLFLLESILGDDQSVSYNSLEEKNMAFLVNCLQNWLVKWELECRSKLLTQRQKDLDSHFYKFNTGALLRTNIKSTMETLSLGVSSRIYSPNDARDKLDENPYEGGDTYANPAIDTVASQPSAQVQDMVRARIARMVKAESSELVRATKKRNYLDWLDSFYNDRWECKLIEGVEECGGTAEQAEQHCEQSRELILAATSVPPDQLRDSIEEVVSSWDQRAESLAESILNKDVINVPS